MALLSALVISVVLGSATRKEIQRHAGENLAEHAEHVASHLTSELGERMSELDAVADLLALEASQGTLASLQRRLIATKQRLPAYSWLGLVDSSGSLILSTDLSLLGADLSASRLVQRVFREAVIIRLDNTAVFDRLLGLSESDSDRLISFAAPLQEGQVGGRPAALLAQIDWTWIGSGSWMRSQQLESENFEIVVLGTDGTRLWAPTHTTEAQRQCLAEIARSASGGGSQYVLDSQCGDQEYLLAYARTNAGHDEDMSWTVFLRQPSAAAFAPALAFERQALIFGLFFGGLFWGVGWMMAHQLVRPLEQISASAARVAKGSGSLALPSSDGNDEIAQLSQSINQMLGRIYLQEEILRKSEQQYRALFEEAADGVWLTGPRGEVLEVNRSACEMLGFERDELLGSDILGLVGRRAVDIDPEPFGAESGGGSSFERWIKRKDGRYILVEASSRRLAQDLCLSIVRDITVRHKAEEALRRARVESERHAQELERKVAERTSQLRASLRSMEGVTYTIAHDLKSPLRSMEGFSTILLEHCSHGLDEFGQDCARRVAEAARRMHRMVDDLLDYARLHHVEIPLCWLDLQRILESALTGLAPKAAQANADIRVRGPLPSVWANSIVTERVFRCLLSNALKFCRPDVPCRIEIWADTGESSVRICFQDNGIGIEPEHVSRIFRVFERLHAGGEYSGTGIGLALVAKAMERMGGCVGVESRPGEGSRFWVEFPLVIPLSQNYIAIQEGERLTPTFE